MRPLTLDRPTLTTLRLGLVLMVAFMLVLTRLPLAQAQDPSGEDGASAPVEPLEENTDEPAEGPGEVPEPVDDGSAPADEGTTGAPEPHGEGEESTEPAAPPAENEAPVVDESTDPANAPPKVEATEDSTEESAATSAAAAEDEVTAAAAPTGGDFSIDWAAAHPSSYNHITGSGGTYGSGSNTTTVESLNSGDFRCGEQVVYFAAITADPGDTDPSEITITTSFQGLTTGQPGIGHEEIVGVSLQENAGGDGVTLVGWSQSESGSTVLGSVTLGDFEGGEFVVVKYRVRLGCPTGSPEGGTGVIHASLTSARVTAPGNSTINTGNQTIPFKQSGSIPRSDLTVTKVVEGNAPAGATYVVNVVCDLGIAETLTFTGNGTQSVAQVPQTDTCTVTETTTGGADRTKVSVNGGAATTGTSASLVIGAGTNNVTFTNTFLAPDMELRKSASLAEVAPGGAITYTVTATNSASSQIAARGVTITDNLDNNLTGVIAKLSVDGGAPTNCTVGAGNTISCSVGDLGIGKSAVVTITATAAAASCNSFLLNTATVTGSNVVSEDSNRVEVEVVCDPDLRLTKLASKDTVNAGEQYTYTIRATNPSTATDAARGVVITDRLAAGVTVDDASYRVGTGAETDCQISGRDVSCAVGNIGIGEVATVTITVTPTAVACPSVVNRAAATGTNFANTQSAAVTVNVVCTPGLTIAKTASKANVVPGGSFSYEITVTSPGSVTAPATNVVITDNLHDGLNVSRPSYRLNGGAATNCDAVGAGNTIRCAVGSVAPGDSVVVTVPVTATRDSCGPITNVATVAASNIANSLGSNQVTVNVSCTPDLRLRKSASATTVQSGSPITYTIAVENPATATLPAEDVVVTDDLDDGLTNLDASYTKGQTQQACAVNSLNGVRCDIGDIAIGETVTITITATTTPAACGEVRNTSRANGTNFTTVTSNEVIVTVVCPPAMTIVKSSSTGTVRPGDVFTYTITATNAPAAGQPAAGVVVSDDLANTLTNVSAQYRVGAGALRSCTSDSATNSVSCNVGNLAAGTSAVVTITATASPAACGTVRNVSSAAGTNFTTITSNEVAVNVVCSPALGLRKFASAGTVQAGSPITYTIEASNPSTATQAAQAVVITDNLSDALTNVTASVRNGQVTTNCAVAAGNAISCTAGDIAVGGIVTVHVTATTTTAACGVVDNRATADGSNFDPVPSNTVTVNVECPPVMSVTKSASTGAVSQGQAFTYTITATNAATAGQAARNVVITDDLEDRLTGVTATYRVGAGAATACDATGAGNTIRCAVGNLAVGGSATVTINVTSPTDSCETLRNVSSAAGSNFTTVVSRQVEVDISCDVETDEPSIRVVKTGTATDRAVGDDILYTYVVTNTGKVRLTQVDLTDDVLGDITLSDTTLDPGESTTATATHEIIQADVDRGDVENVATTTGRTPTNSTVRDTDDEVVLIPRQPRISMTKVPNVDTARVGDVVEYTYVITNNGDTTLTDITLTDDKIGTIVAVSDRVTLTPGAQHTVTVPYTVVEEDVTRTNEVVNVAVATGLPPSGPPISTTTTARVQVPPIDAPATLLQVVKRVTGDTGPAAGAQFGFTVDCGDATSATGGKFTLPEDGGTYDVGRLPVGQDCTVEETRDAGATSTTVAVGTAPAVAGTVAEFTTVEGVTTVTFVNRFQTRPVCVPGTGDPRCDEPPVCTDADNCEDLPATGTNLMIQLLLGLGALALGSSVLRRFQPAAVGSSRPRRRASWFRG